LISFVMFSEDFSLFRLLFWEFLDTIDLSPFFDFLEPFRLEVLGFLLSC
jgi:hypothetical protein